MKIKLDTEVLDAMSRNPSNWRGPFYYNPKDPRLRVPKLYPSFGSTLNFASIYSYLLIIAIVLILIASQLFL